MKNLRIKPWVLSLAVVGAGLLPFASHAWSMGQNMYQGHNNYVTAQYWCGSYYSSYPCQQYQPQQYQMYQQYQPYTYTQTNYTAYDTYQYTNQQYVPASFYSYPTTYSYQNLAGTSGYYNSGYGMNPPVYPAYNNGGYSMNNNSMSNSYYGY